MTSGTHTVRAFIWHVNALGSSRYLSLFARASSGTVTVSSRQYAERHDSSYAAAGICIAKVHLYDQWDSISGSQSVSQSEVAVWQSQSTSNGQLVGAVVQFTVTSDHDFTLCLRSAISTGTGAPGSWDEEPAADPGQHVRGWWPFSTLTTAAGTIDVKPPQSGDTTVRVEVCDAGNTEFSTFAQTQGDAFGTERGNKGCYGANLNYDFAVSNTGNQAYPLFIYGQARNITGAFVGAARITQPSVYPDLGVPGLSCSGPAQASGKWVRLTTSNGDNEVPPNIAQGASLNYRVSVAVGGSGGTPFNIVLSTLGVELSEEPEI